MNKKWIVLNYETGDGYCEIERFLDSLSGRNRAKVLSWIAALTEQGPYLPRPFADLVEDGIHELRIKLSGEQFRILYYFCYGNYIILSHPFLKSTDTIPDAEVRKAKKNRAEFLQRNTLLKLQEQTHENI